MRVDSQIAYITNYTITIRYFQSETQKSISNIHQISIKPVTEFLSFSNEVDPTHFGKQKFSGI